MIIETKNWERVTCCQTCPFVARGPHGSALQRCHHVVNKAKTYEERQISNDAFYKSLVHLPQGFCPLGEHTDGFEYRKLIEVL